MLATDAPAGIAWVEICENESEVRRWLGEPDLDVRVVDGPSGLRAVGIRLADDQVVEMRDW
jgi:hypothetical protein